MYNKDKNVGIKIIWAIILFALAIFIDVGIYKGIKGEDFSFDFLEDIIADLSADYEDDYAYIDDDPDLEEDYSSEEDELILTEPDNSDEYTSSTLHFLVDSDKNFWGTATIKKKDYTALLEAIAEVLNRSDLKIAGVGEKYYEYAYYILTSDGFISYNGVDKLYYKNEYYYVSDYSSNFTKIMENIASEEKKVMFFEKNKKYSLSKIYDTPLTDEIENNLLKLWESSQKNIEYLDLALIGKYYLYIDGDILVFDDCNGYVEYNGGFIKFDKSMSDELKIFLR